MAKKMRNTKNNVIGFFYKLDDIIYKFGDKIL